MSLATGNVREPDDITEEHHVVFRRSVPCGGPQCRETAHRWMRCPSCKRIVARCGAHDQRLDEQVRSHCP